MEGSDISRDITCKLTATSATHKLISVAMDEKADSGMDEMELKLMYLVMRSG